VIQLTKHFVVVVKNQLHLNQQQNNYTNHQH